MGDGKRETVVHTPDSGKNVTYIHTGFLLFLSFYLLLLFLFSIFFFLLLLLLLSVVGYWGF